MDAGRGHLGRLPALGERPAGRARGPLQPAAAGPGARAGAACARASTGCCSRCARRPGRSASTCARSPPAARGRRAWRCRDAVPPLEKRCRRPAPRRCPPLTAALARAGGEAARTTPCCAASTPRVLAFSRAYRRARAHRHRGGRARGHGAPRATLSLQLLAAAHQRDDHNLRRQLPGGRAQGGAGLAPARAGAGRARAGSRPPRARAAAARAGGGEDARARPRRGWRWPARSRRWASGPRAAGMVEETFRAAAARPRVVRAAAMRLARLERSQEALDRLRVALALRFDDSASRRTARLAAGGHGQASDAARASSSSACSSWTRSTTARALRLAELLAANGQLDGGGGVFAEAARARPGRAGGATSARAGRCSPAGRREEALRRLRARAGAAPAEPGAARRRCARCKGETGEPGDEVPADVQARWSKEADGYAGRGRGVPGGRHLRARAAERALRALPPARGEGAHPARRGGVPHAARSPTRPTARRCGCCRARITKPDGRVVDSYGDSERNINEPWTGMYYDARAKMLSFPALAPGDVLELQYRIEDTAQDNLLSDYWGDVEYVQGVYPKLRYQYLGGHAEGAARSTGTRRSCPGLRRPRSEDAAEAAACSTAGRRRTCPRWCPSRACRAGPRWPRTLHVSTYKTWEQVGRYWWGLVRDQLTPNDELRQTVEQVLKGVDRKDDQAVVPRRLRLRGDQHPLRGAGVRHPRLQAVPGGPGARAPLRRLQGQGVAHRTRC